MLACMSDTQALAIIILLAVIAGCLLVLLLVVISGGRCLQRIAGSLEQRKGAGDAAGTVLTTRKSRPDGEFETFLNEDPTRLQLTKSEQFSAYRKWRQDKGMNWSPP
jgi:hypothetical protein